MKSKKVFFPLLVLINAFLSPLFSDVVIINFSQLSIGTDAFWNDVLTWDPMTIPNADNVTVVFPPEIAAPTMDLIGINPTVNYIIFELGGVTINNAGTLNFRGSLPGPGIQYFPGTTDISNTIEANITVDSSPMTITTTSGSELTLSGTYSGGSIAKVGEGNLIYNNAAVFSEDVDIQGGTFNLSGTSTLYSNVMSGTGGFVQGSSATTLTLNQAQTYTGDTNVVGGLTLSGSGSINNSKSLFLDSGGSTFTLSSGIGARTIGTLAGLGTITLNNNSLTIQQEGIGTYTGTIAGDSSSGITLTGNGALTLTGAILYEGTTSIEGSTLTLLSSTNLDNSSAVALSMGASLNLQQSGASYTLNNLSSTNYGDTLNLTNATLTIDQTSSSTFAGNITGTGSIEKTGASSTLTFTGPVSFSGSATISEGSVTLEDTGSLGSCSSMTVSASGTLNANTSTSLNALQGSGSVVVGSGSTLTLQGSSSTFSGIISGAGGINKNGTQTLTLSGANTYLGDTSIDQGSITLAGSGSLESSSSVVVTGSLLLDTDSGNQTLKNLSGSGNVMVNGTSLTVNQNSTDGELSGGLLGSGNFTKSGAYTLTLSGTNTNSGTLTVSEGQLDLSGSSSFEGTTTVSSGAVLALLSSGNLESSSLLDVGGTLALHYGNQTIQDLSGAGSVLLYGNTLTLSNGGNTFSGVISDGSSRHQGSFIKSGSGNSVLSGANTFGGSLTVSEGGLTLSNTNDYQGNTTIAQGATLTLTGSGSIENSGLVTVDGTLTLSSTSGLQSFQALEGSGSISNQGTGITLNQSALDTNFSGTISQTGTFTKQGNSTLTFSGTYSSSGDFTVTGGTVVLTGSISSADIFINQGGTLKGNGTTGSGVLTNRGVVAPGNSIGTLTVQGDYTQTPTGNLEVEINPSTSDVLNVTGMATLDGTVTIIPQAGSYPRGTSYTFLTAGTVNDSFSTLTQLEGITGTLSYPGNSVVYTLQKAHHVLPVSASNLKGNAQHIARYLFRSGVQPNNPDLDSVYQTLLNLTDQNFPTALRKLGPTQFGALPLVSLQSDVRIAQGFVSNWKKDLDCLQCEKKGSVSLPFCKMNPEYPYSIWFEPLVFDYSQDAYKQHNIEEQIKFNSITYGANVGFSKSWAKGFSLIGELAYTHSNLHWEKNAGNGKWSSFYVGPGIGYFSDTLNAYFDLVALGAINFYNLDRRIVFPGLERVAQSRHLSYDLLIRTDAGIRVRYLQAFIQPEVTLNYLTIFEEKYNEHGANSLDLTVFSNYHVYLRPECSVKVGLEFFPRQLCIVPSLKLGWVSNIPVTNGIYHARLKNETFTIQNQFPVLSFHRTTNQLVAGAELTLKKKAFLFSGIFDANYLDRNMVQEGKLRFEWSF